MSLQMRLSETADKRLYNPNRDVAHNFAFVAGEIAKRLEHKKWPMLHSLLPATTDDALGHASVTFCEFITTAVDHPEESMAAAMDRCGWHQVPPSAQIAYMSYLGMVTAGIYFHGVRESTLGGIGPCSDLQWLTKAAWQCQQAMAIPRWRRPFHRLYWRLLRVIHALKSSANTSAKEGDNAEP